MPIQIPFRTGDVVMVESGHHLSGENIIHECDIGHDNHSYSTNLGAWVNHSQCVLVREADKKSLKKLLKCISEDY